MQFTYVNPTVIHFGQGQINAISQAVDTSKKVLVIYGGGSIKSNGVYDQVVESLKDHAWIEFSGVEANPTKDTIKARLNIRDFMETMRSSGIQTGGPAALSQIGRAHV